MVKLEAPGAGLPAVERLVANAMLRTNALIRSRTSIDCMFDTEAKLIVSTCKELSPEQGRTQVLIDRFIGIEDSSRDWSVYMTVQHLCITTPGMCGVIQSLTGGDSFDQVIRIEDVKPNPKAGPECVDEFKQPVGEFQSIVRNIPKLSTGKRHDHPWFGACNAKQWAFLAAVHTQIHRKQIQKICRQLR